MSYIDEIVVPGVDGRVFSTKISETAELNALKDALLQIGGVVGIEFNTDVFPTEVKIVTDRVVNIDEVQEVANSLEAHLIPKS